MLLCEDRLLLGRLFLCVLVDGYENMVDVDEIGKSIKEGQESE